MVFYRVSMRASAVLRCRTAALGLLSVLLSAGTSQASFHIMHIQRILTGLNGTSDVQFVELQMDDDGQNLVSGSKLIAFNADGSFNSVAVTLNKSVTNDSQGNSILIASTSFEEAIGLKPDFVFPDGSLPTLDGMVCWGKPTDQTNPNSTNMIDCLSYGNFTGPDNNHTSAPAPTSPFGHVLTRISSTNNSANDYVCEEDSFAVSNAPDKKSVIATTPCSGAPECGNGTVEDPEECDDGDTDSVTGDFCSADCLLFGCGIPTSTTSATPKTSDALFVLKAAVGSASCDLEVCDVNDSLSVNTSDALLVLKKAVGQPVILDCPSVL